LWRGAPHTANKSTCVFMGCPLPTYIKEGGPAIGGAPKGWSLTPSRSRFHHFLVLLGERRKEEEGRRKGGSGPKP